MTHHGTVVIKVGGSVLRDRESYRQVSRFLANRTRRGRPWAVVSAARGVTDALYRLSRTANPDAARSLLDRHEGFGGIANARDLAQELWRGVSEARVGRPDRLLAWGERASAAALQGHLADLGVALPVVELSPQAPCASDGPAIVPGFYLRDREGRVRILPRGGSDISALILAAKIGARSVVFWKNGGGLRGDGGSIHEIDAEELLPRLSGTIRPLHPAALVLAARRGIDLILEDPFGNHEPTRIVARGPSRPTESVSSRAESPVPPGQLALIPSEGPR